MEAVEAEKRSLTPEEHERLDRIFEDVDTFDERAKADAKAARVQELAKSLDEPVGRIATAARAAHKESRTDDEYRAAFGTYLRTGQPQAELRTLSSGTNTAGGYIVPETLENRIVEKLYEAGMVRQLATVRSTPDDRKIAVEGSLGTASWVNEGNAISQVDVSFDQLTIGAYKAATSIQVNRELMDDSVFDLESYLVDKLTLRISRLTEDAYINGDGSNKPSGLLRSIAAGHTLPNASGQRFEITDAQEVYEWLHSLSPQYRPGAVILCHDKFVKQLRKLQDANDRFLWEPNMQVGAPGSIGGVPYYTSEFHPQPGGATGAQASQIAATYGMFRYFEIYDRGGTEMLVDPYTNSLNWRTNIHVVRRTDSIRTLDDAFSTLKMAAS